MAANIPAKLKSLDITRFAVRASQLEKFKPVIAYWCEYHIVNQILAKGMHTEDDECMTYTTTLMDKLEKMKTTHAGESAILDDAAAQAYVEQFAYEVLDRGEKAIRTDTVTKQTADTLQAAITFLDLIGIWKPGQPDVAAKLKYAKYHAVRIVKAIRAGEDPNLSNPKPEPPPEDPNDPEVQTIDGSSNWQPPSVEGAPSDDDTSPIPPARSPVVPAQPTPSIRSLHTSQPPSLPQHDEVSPLEPSPPASCTGSVGGGGYFPPVPTFTAEPRDPNLSTAPGDSAGLPPASQTSAPLNPTPQYSPAPQDPTPHYSPPSQQPTPSPYAPPPQQQPPFQPPPSQHHQPAASPHDFYRPSPTPQAPHQPPQQQLPFHPSPQPQPQPHHPQLPQQHYTPQPAPTPAPAPPASYTQPAPPTPHLSTLRTDDESIADAQKHARWAVSAMQFEDVVTAVKELRVALRALGAE
ncbi:DUF605-domain-containing protein [Eremomyces bilateralis CBS 781.70]|uniref:DUF605-domain-containing protein n=1 Tax=Eremomyces bilateralis CBS 781.70 TaxID=1392243 RepID=A0A6G1FRA9_9PEZI|nr:DUF605-domain-containing protein [Eremomyces bilateralis CBS 781.70]KAF1808202.1 DUF605-domain-containing protein [Eremomyces bilateralis CBS 781.70]